jgi:hypothetical protein
LIGRLSEFVVQTSQSRVRFLLATLLGMPMLFLVLFPIMHAFRELVGGLQPFDWQQSLTQRDVFAQLPLYTATTRNLYLAHAYVDTIFPVFVGVFFGALAAFALRNGAPLAYDFLRRHGIFAMFLFSVPFDWVENAASLVLIYGYPRAPAGIAGLLIAANRVKLFAEPLIPIASAALVAVGVMGGLIQRLRRSVPS